MEINNIITKIILVRIGVIAFALFFVSLFLFYQLLFGGETDPYYWFIAASFLLAVIIIIYKFTPYGPVKVRISEFMKKMSVGELTLSIIFMGVGVYALYFTHTNTGMNVGGVIVGGAFIYAGIRILYKKMISMI